MPVDRTQLGGSAALALAAVYTREIRVSIDRIWENLLDWEHLPAPHEIYFIGIALLEIGDWGWRVELTKAPGTGSGRIVSELRIDRANARYCIRTLAGDGAGTEIWTMLEALEPRRTAVEVQFYLPEHRPEELAKLGEKHRRSHARLWDQDEAMMMRREALSTPGKPDRRRPRPRSPSAPCANCASGSRFSSSLAGSRFAFSSSRTGRSSCTARFARIGWVRSRIPCGRMAAALSLARLSVRHPDRY